MITWLDTPFGIFHQQMALVEWQPSNILLGPNLRIKLYSSFFSLHKAQSSLCHNACTSRRWHERSVDLRQTWDKSNRKLAQKLTLFHSQDGRHDGWMYVLACSSVVQASYSPILPPASCRIDHRFHFWYAALKLAPRADLTGSRRNKYHKIRSGA